MGRVITEIWLEDSASNVLGKMSHPPKAVCGSIELKPIFLEV
jgi:hypothetical protein